MEEKENISGLEFARRMGCSGDKITNWMNQGKLKRLPNKKYRWPECKEDFLFHERTKVKNHIANKGKPKQKKGKRKEDASQADFVQPADITINQEEVKDSSVVERIIAELREGIEGSEATAYQYGRAMNELIKAQKEQLKLLELEKKTLTKKEVEEWVFKVSRQNRNNWLNWPDLIAVELSEELDVDRRLLYEALLKRVRINLEKIATLPVTFGASTADTISEGATTASEDGLG